uniref:Uncharacterized protein n=1 Tax=Rhizophora mucronata TaxID=61149 RepID=A0A2P2QSN2_RHIMU
MKKLQKKKIGCYWISNLKLYLS